MLQDNENANSTLDDPADDTCRMGEQASAGCE